MTPTIFVLIFAALQSVLNATLLVRLDKAERRDASLAADLDVLRHDHEVDIGIVARATDANFSRIVALRHDLEGDPS